MCRPSNELHFAVELTMKPFGLLAIFFVLCGSAIASGASHSSDTQPRIREALSAAPPAIAAAAAVVTKDGKGRTVVLRHGRNGWTCMPGHRGPGADPWPRPACFDANGMAWLAAIEAGRAPDPNKPALSYMLQGGSAWSNTDQKADRLPAGAKHYIRIPPHVMILDARLANASGAPSGQANPDTHEPFVMFGGTPYAILIVPVR